MNVTWLIVIPIAAVAIVIAVLAGNGFFDGKTPAAIVTSALGFEPPFPDKLGWMDEEPLTASDRARIATIAGGGAGDNLGVIRSMQAGARSSVNRRDFELLRQDRRRARAAYPDAVSDNMMMGTWLQVDLSAKVPDSFCTSHNSNGTMIDGKWYLDGGCFVGVVRPEYPNRATAEQTKAFFEEEKRKQREAKLARLKESGPFAMMGGSGGSLSVSLNKNTGRVEIVVAQEWSRTGTKWTVPFFIEEWADISPYDLDAIKKLPSFVHESTEETVQVTPSGVSVENAVSTGMTNSFAMPYTLGPGESVGVGVTIPAPPK